LDQIIAAVYYVWNVMAHAQKLDFVFRRKGRIHLNRQERQFSRLLAAKLCASAVVMLDTPCSVVVWRVLTTHSIRQFPLHFPSRTSPCAITFHLDSNSDECTCYALSTLHSVPKNCTKNIKKLKICKFKQLSCSGLIDMVTRQRAERSRVPIQVETLRPYSSWTTRAYCAHSRGKKIWVSLSDSVNAESVTVLV